MPQKTKCKFGHDACDGINGTSMFICNDCVEDAVNAKLRGEGGPACEIIEPFDVAKENDMAMWDGLNGPEPGFKSPEESHARVEPAAAPEATEREQFEKWARGHWCNWPDVLRIWPGSGQYFHAPIYDCWLAFQAGRASLSGSVVETKFEHKSYCPLCHGECKGHRIYFNDKEPK